MIELKLAAKIHHRASELMLGKTFLQPMAMLKKNLHITRLKVTCMDYYGTFIPE